MILEALLAVLHPSVQIHSLMTEAERADYHGHQGAREWCAAVFDVFPDWSPLIVEISPVADDAAVVAFTARATGTGSGVRIDRATGRACTSARASSTLRLLPQREDAVGALGLGGEGTRQ